MTDHTLNDSHVSALLEEHDPHHGHGGKPWTDSVPAPRCHAVSEWKSGAAPSQHTINTIESILASGRGTPVQRLAAQSWIDRYAPKETTATPAFASL